MNFDDVLPAFIAEASELLREMEDGLLECTRGPASDDTINLIFRAAHTIKGSSGLFGLDPIVSFVHGVESLLDRVRLGELALDAPLIQLLLACKDHTAALVELATDLKNGLEPAMQARSEALLAELGAVQSGVASKGAGAAASGAAGRAAGGGAGASVGADTAAGWQISLRFSPDVLMAGMDPLAFIRYLTTFGTITALTVVDEDLPRLSGLDPHKCYLGFEITLETPENRARVESAFEFVREDCTLKIEPLVAAIPASITAEPSAPGSGGNRAADANHAASATAETSSAPPRATQDVAATSVRVDAARLDWLITRIGELIISAAGANLAARRSGSVEVEESLSALSSLVEEVRGGALQLRMVKIGGTFNRFSRVVHDVSRELGKEIRLLVSGEDAELDKTLVEKIADPLTHLVRNAIDHGIEPADVRLARGKPAAGTVRLNAFHDSGTIVIEVSDDGGGLKRERILAKAQERGLIDPARTLSDAEICNLIFEPGFSTAEKITNLSGRGVGMDVVKRNITALRGEVGVRSTEGAGTTVTVRLPLTLAIINGFQISIGDSMFVLPLESIEECVEYSADAEHDFTSLRGEVLPFVRLRDLFHISGAPARRQSIVVVRHAGQRAGLVVDTLHGESQAVIKPLAGMFRRAECVSGSSILGTGEVALILDVGVLVEQAAARNALRMSA